MRSLKNETQMFKIVSPFPLTDSINIRLVTKLVFIESK
jgi:hypothetical protein